MHVHNIGFGYEKISMGHLTLTINLKLTPPNIDEQQHEYQSYVLEMTGWL